MGLVQTFEREAFLLSPVRLAVRWGAKLAACDLCIERQPAIAKQASDVGPRHKPMLKGGASKYYASNALGNG